MTLRIETGKIDGGTEKNTLIASENTDLKLKQGDVISRGQRTNRFEIREGHSHLSKEQVWVRGVVLLLGFVTIASTIGVLAAKLPLYVLPLILCAIVVTLYLFGILLLPKEVAAQGFVTIFREFMKAVLRKQDLKGP
jgi:hypothetical protein